MSCGSCGGHQIVIAYGDVQAGGKLAGLTVAEVKEIIARDVPQMQLPAGVVARLMTMDAIDAAWQKVTAPEEMSVLTHAGVDGKLAILQGVAKDVPDDYVIREADVYLEFRDPSA